MAELAKSWEANDHAARNNNRNNNRNLGRAPAVERSVLSFSDFYEYDNSLGYPTCKEPTIRNPVFVITASQSTVSSGHPAARSPTRATIRVATAATIGRPRRKDSRHADAPSKFPSAVGLLETADSALFTGFGITQISNLRAFNTACEFDSHPRLQNFYCKMNRLAGRAFPCTPRVGRLCQPRAVIEENKDRYYETLEPKFSALGMGARTMRGLISITFSSFSRVRTPILRNELAA